MNCLNKRLPMVKYVSFIKCIVRSLMSLLVKLSLPCLTLDQKDVEPRIVRYLRFPSFESFPPLKAKSTISFRFFINSSWGSLVYKVLKSYVEMSFAFFFELILVIFSMTGNEFSIGQNLL